jgi:DNA polymerase I-like protein with 3'-5' exonuclease and polymerase domains
MTIFATSVVENRVSSRVIIINNVHDATYFYIPNDLIEETLPIIQNTMEHLPLMKYFGKTIDSVPIKIDFEGSKKSWGDLK